MEQSMKDTVFLCVVEIIVDAFQTKEIKLENHQAEIIWISKLNGETRGYPKILALVE